MALVAEHLPSADDRLCESCGYRLNGLPDGANCPECGAPAEDSISGASRKLPAWEVGRPGLRTWARTSLSVLLRPARFYRTLRTRADPAASWWYALGHWSIASLLLSWAAVLHGQWILRFYFTSRQPAWILLAAGIVIGTLLIALFWQLSRLAALFTFWEGRYWGYRLPYPAVLRAIHYHAVHFLPVCAMGLLTVLTWRLGLREGWFDGIHASNYLYLLSAEVILGAGYIFYTYTIAMRRIMYANV